MKTAFVCIALLAVASAFTLQATQEEMVDLWESWKQEHNVFYENANEEAYRFSVFLQNYIAIHEHMEKDPYVELGLNKFATLTSEEFGAKMRCTDVDASSNCVGMSDGSCPKYPQSNLPDSKDWRGSGALTPVKNQGDCGSCWAFSTTGCLEGLYYLNNTKLLSFSEQQFVDCETDTNGCGGGLMSLAMIYASKYGVETEENYPYNAADGQCKYDSSKAMVVNKGCNCVEPKSIEQLEAAVAEQPVSIAVQANQLSWQFYKGGVISSFCGAELDHGVLAVGFIKEKGKSAWVVKNSWGADWGAKGFLYIERNYKNDGKGSCGVLAQPVVATNN